MVASASPSLPHKSAAQLLVDVSKSAETPLSGTVVETARLGLPALPDIGGTAISPTALLAGSHTARVWYDGADKARVALVGNLAETDLVRNGRDVWLWTSGPNTAQHVRLPATSAHKDGSAPSPSPTESLTPQQAAQQALAAVDPTTKVTVDGTASVAGRSAYELVLAPRDARSLVGDVRIAVDAKTSVPLRVQVHAAGATGRPAFETTFTSVSFTKPSVHVFRFTPPPGAKVTTTGIPSVTKDAKDAKDTARTAGTGIGAEGDRHGLDRGRRAVRGVPARRRPGIARRAPICGERTAVGADESDDPRERCLRQQNAECCVRAADKCCCSTTAGRSSAPCHPRSSSRRPRSDRTRRDGTGCSASSWQSGFSRDPQRGTDEEVPGRTGRGRRGGPPGAER